MNEDPTIETAEAIGHHALPAAVHPAPLSDRLLAFVVIGSGFLVTLLWVCILVYALIMFLF